LGYANLSYRVKTISGTDRQNLINCQKSETLYGIAENSTDMCIMVINIILKFENI